MGMQPVLFYHSLTSSLVLLSSTVLHFVYLIRVTLGDRYAFTALSQCVLILAKVILREHQDSTQG